VADHESEAVGEKRLDHGSVFVPFEGSRGHRFDVVDVGVRPARPADYLEIMNVPGHLDTEFQR
jgi:hypothetical protein